MLSIRLRHSKTMRLHHPGLCRILLPIINQPLQNAQLPLPSSSPGSNSKSCSSHRRHMRRGGPRQPGRGLWAGRDSCEGGSYGISLRGSGCHLCDDGAYCAGASHDLRPISNVRHMSSLGYMDQIPVETSASGICLVDHYNHWLSISEGQ